MTNVRAFAFFALYLPKAQYKIASKQERTGTLTRDLAGVLPKTPAKRIDYDMSMIKLDKTGGVLLNRGRRLLIFGMRGRYMRSTFVLCTNRAAACLSSACPSLHAEFLLLSKNALESKLFPASTYWIKHEYFPDPDALQAINLLVFIR